MTSDTGQSGTFFHNTAEVVPEGRIFFAFASGRFAYDCGTCGSQCCRGHGFDLRAGAELTRHVEANPALAFFVRPSSPRAAFMLVGNCPPSCFFLDDRGRCDIQVRLGHAAKPETCRLFPFNNMKTVGDHLIVAPHSSLCPLQVVPPPADSAQSRHAALLQEMTRGIERPDRTLPIAAADVPRLIGLETSIVRLSEQHLDRPAYTAFAGEQLRATREYFGYSTISAAAAAEEMRQFSSLSCRILGLDAHHVEPETISVARVYTATTPYLRSEMLFPRQGTAERLRISPARVPHVLSALFVFVSLAERAGMKTITFQTISRLWQDHRAIVTLLGLADVPVAWRDDAAIAPPPDLAPAQLTQFVAIVKALLAVRRGRQRSLSEILCDVLDTQGIARMSSLRSLSPHLLAGVAPIDTTEVGGDGKGKAKWKARLQQMLWRHSDVDALALALRRRAGKHAAG